MQPPFLVVQTVRVRFAIPSQIDKKLTCALFVPRLDQQIGVAAASDRGVVVQGISKCAPLHYNGHYLGLTQRVEQRRHNVLMGGLPQHHQARFLRNLLQQLVRPLQQGSCICMQQERQSVKLNPGPDIGSERIRRERLARLAWAVQGADHTSQKAVNLGCAGH